jgi:hypothetical protein
MQKKVNHENLLYQTTNIKLLRIQYDVNILSFSNTRKVGAAARRTSVANLLVYIASFLSIKKI